MTVSPLGFRPLARALALFRFARGLPPPSTHRRAATGPNATRACWWDVTACFITPGFRMMSICWGLPTSWQRVTNCSLINHCTRLLQYLSNQSIAVGLHILVIISASVGSTGAPRDLLCHHPTLQLQWRRCYLASLVALAAKAAAASRAFFFFRPCC